MDLENSLIENELRKYRKSNIDRYDINNIFGYIYLTILPNTQYYVGQKKNLPSMSENYYGSGKILNNWFNKHLNVNSNNCPKELADINGVIKIILDYAIDRDELNFLESEYIRYAKDIAEFNKQCLNIRSGDYISDFIEASEEGKKRFKEKMRGRIPWNKGLTRETSDIVNRISNKKIGKKRTKEQRELISRKTKEAMAKLPPEKRKKLASNGMKGKHHPKETIEKIRKSNLGKKHIKSKR